MDIKYLQKGILNYCWLQPTVKYSFNVFKTLCNGLYFNDFEESVAIKPEYKIFFPLVRYGLLEFYGKNEYGLAPSVILYNKFFIIEWNIIDKKIFNFSNQIEFDNPFNIRIYENSITNLKVLNTSTIPSSNFHFVNCLDKFPSFQRIINAWNNDVTIETQQYQFFNSYNNWENTYDTSRLGLYKKSPEVYSQRTLHFSEDNWKLVPSFNTNIESINIANMWSKIKNDFKIELLYNKQENKIQIRDIHFPVLFERLLLINTLLNGKLTFRMFDREYFLSEIEFLRLNKFFNYKIAAI